jgi:hypothetical protein
METDALMETVKTNRIFPLFPQRLENSQTTATFPQFPQPLLLVTKNRNDTKRKTPMSYHSVKRTVALPS